MAVYLKKKRKCRIVVPAWLGVGESRSGFAWWRMRERAGRMELGTQSGELVDGVITLLGWDSPGSARSAREELLRLVRAGRGGGQRVEARQLRA